MSPNQIGAAEAYCPVCDEVALFAILPKYAPEQAPNHARCLYCETLFAIALEDATTYSVIEDDGEIE